MSEERKRRQDADERVSAIRQSYYVEKLIFEDSDKITRIDFDEVNTENRAICSDFENFWLKIPIPFQNRKYSIKTEHLSGVKIEIRLFWLDKERGTS